jgi:hypothetical protein
MSSKNQNVDSDNDVQNIDYGDPTVLRELYWERELSLAEIGNRADVSAPTIRYWMKKYGIPRREPNTEKPPYLRETKGGYLRIHTSDTNGGLDRVYVHRLVAVAEYGFEAVRDNHVHHESGHGLDNRPDNLVPLSPAEHAAEHDLGRKRDENGRFIGG